MKQLLTLYFFSFALGVSAQKPGWQNLDLAKDSVFGISTEKAYQQILSHKKKWKPVIVGVIDSGVDTAHEDLRSVIWTNPKETYNGMDGDHDGYVNDVHGWDFIGGPKGDVNHETLELTRMIRHGQATPAMLEEYQKAVTNDSNVVQNILGFKRVLQAVIEKIGKDSPSLADFQSFATDDPYEQYVKREMTKALEDNPDFHAIEQDEIDAPLNHFRDLLDYDLNLNYQGRSIVGDDTANASEHLYGNADVTGPAALHGTHVAGIIAADRTNHIGIDGIADHAWILSIRTVPDGDERDKDVANAIRYAADHGARVINMSFGKAYSPDKKVVDEAVKYAVARDVLLIHGAGNEGKNLDHEPNYPNPIYQDSSGIADAWIEVGASGQQNDSSLAASFSNWGKKRVDVFAPGVGIHSTIPGSKYADESGTSMACPVTAGLAVLIREYYPKLTAVQVKQIILQSVTKPAQLVVVRDAGHTLQLPFSEICVSGGIINAYQALKLAASF